jgi:RNA polymerase sigma factor (sigma-70 family)
MSWKELEHETTETLIEYIRWRGDPELAATAEDAFRAFCFRFQQDVVKKCHIICRNHNYDLDVADDLAQRTFERFLKYPKFDIKKSPSKDFDTGVKLYLYGIAQKQLYNLHDENQRASPYIGDEETTDQLVPIENLQVKAEQRNELRAKYELIKKALDRLSPKHRIIYCTYQRYQKDGIKMPRHLTEKLRTELQLTQATIQFYKKEAYDKVKEYLEIYGSK